MVSVVHGLLNFVAIGQTVAEIWRFFDFQDGVRLPIAITITTVICIAPSTSCPRAHNTV